MGTSTPGDPLPPTPRGDFPAALVYLSRGLLLGAGMIWFGNDNFQFLHGHMLLVGTGLFAAYGAGFRWIASRVDGGSLPGVSAATANVQFWLPARRPPWGLGGGRRPPRLGVGPGGAAERCAGLDRAESVWAARREVEVAPPVLPRRQNRQHLRRLPLRETHQSLLVEVPQDDEVDPLSEQAQGKNPCLPLRKRPFVPPVGGLQLPLDPVRNREEDGGGQVRARSVGEVALRYPFEEAIREIRAVPRVPVGEEQPLVPDRRQHLPLRHDVEGGPLLLPLQVEIAIPLDVVEPQARVP